MLSSHITAEFAESREKDSQLENSGKRGQSPIVAEFGETRPHTPPSHRHPQPHFQQLAAPYIIPATAQIPLTPYPDPTAFSHGQVYPTALPAPPLWAYMPVAQPVIPLSKPQEKRITQEIMSLYQSLLPTPLNITRRRKFVEKIQRILHEEYPGRQVDVHLFGSSANGLGTGGSDVDLCLVTDWERLQDVRFLAAGLKKHGIRRVTCIPNARVPIVKLWDNELFLACDINVNNPLALQNTEMIKTYVEIDARARPFIMIIKHWARRRVLNDAAKGGTLSTYAWMCMCINFLQMRTPSILPALHQIPHTKRPDNAIVDGVDTSFCSDLDQLRGFGELNSESLGYLLYAFFRHFAFEYEYEKYVISVRCGKYLTKESKGWIGDRNYNLLCIESPMNVFRNLGNSADDITVHGLKNEFQRAYSIIVNGGSLSQVCEQYIEA
ncbi:hypothetical protein BZG36_03205 [Bifiguratus adelaidae]|uniref:polynucleotide adenylyltransferase n=1 Tax=Bifiguratus adelaidae TaxID=1938954 RepID=A0A261Y195_9FUNG|nr:hypothetical protein BZG36_03205 [Bifiguratus adelaidae]